MRWTKRWLKTAAWKLEWKTWLVHSFGKRNVLRFERKLKESREGFCWRGSHSMQRNQRQEAESIGSRPESTGGCTELKNGHRDKIDKRFLPRKKPVLTLQLHFADQSVSETNLII